MKQQLENLRLWLGVAVVCLAASAVAFWLRLTALGAVLGVLAVWAGLALVLIYVRKSAAALSTTMRNVARAKSDAPVRPQGGEDKSLRELVQLAKLQAGTTVVSGAASAPATATKSASPVVAGLVSSAPEAQAPKRVLSVGSPELPLLPDAWVRQTILPGQLPLRSSLADVMALVIDERAFASGPWRSFGERDDAFLIGQLSRAADLAHESGIPVVSIANDESPEHMQVCRRGGLVISDAAELSAAVLGIGTDHVEN